MTYEDFIIFCRKNSDTSYAVLPDLKGLDRIPAEIGQLKNLHHLNLLNGTASSLPPEIGQMESLEYLRISNLPLKEIPKEIGQLKQLHYLALENLVLQDFSFLEVLPNLKTLLLVNCDLSIFPTEIKALSKLEILNLDKNKIVSFPNWFSDLSHIKRLTLSNNLLEEIDFGPNNKSINLLNLENCQLKIIPETIRYLSKLRALKLKKNKIQILPKALSKLSNLDSLNIRDNPLSIFPEHLMGLKKLRFFQFDERWMNQFPYSLLALGALTKIPKGLQVSEPAREIPGLAREVVRKGYAEDYAYFLMDILAERWARIKSHKQSNRYLLESLNCSQAIILNSVLENISKQYDSNKSLHLNKNSIISVLGKTSFNLNNLRNRVKNIGLTYSSRLNDKVTHLLIGRQHKANLDKILELKPIIITETILLNFLNKEDPPYLLEEKENNKEQTVHLSNLLLSPVVDNVELALQMLNSGGVPNSLITELVLIYFNDYPKKTRDLARKLLVQYGPASIHPSFSKTGTTLRKIIQAYNERNFKLNFESICEEHGLDKIKILDYWLLRKDQRWPSIINLMKSFLLSLVSEVEGLIILKDFMKEGVLTLQYLDFSFIPESLLRHKSLTNSVTKIRLNNCKLQKFPNFLLAYKKLVYLNLANNSIRSLPKEMEEFRALEVCILSRNSFKKFPKALIKNPKLHTLMFDNCPISSLDNSLLNCKALRVLSINNNQFEEIPPVLFDMTQLEALNIKRLYRVSLKPYKVQTTTELAAVLKDCKIIG